MKKYIKPLLFIFLWAAAVESITAPIRAFSTALCAVVQGVIYAVLTLFLIKKYKDILKPWVIALCVIICSVVFMAIIDVINFVITGNFGNWSRFFLLNFIWAKVGCIAGWLFYKANKYLKVVIVLLFAGMTYWIGAVFFTMYHNKVAYGTYDGMITEERVYDFVMQNEQGDTIMLSDFRGKYIAFDLWSTTCGACYREMPKFNQIAKDNSDNPEIVFYILARTLGKT